MTFVPWSLVRGIVQSESLDRLEAWTPGKTAKVHSAEGVEPVRDALELLASQVNGEVVVIAWKAAARKAAAYTWTVRSAQPVGSAAPGPDSPSWEKWFDARLELEKLKLEHAAEMDRAGGPIDRLAGLAEELAPQILAAITGRAAPAPVHGAAMPQRAALVPPGAPGEIPDAELQDILAEVVTFARRNPALARQQAETLRKLNTTPNGQEPDSQAGDYQN